MQEEHLFEYAVIRYVPRRERGEFINIGLLLLCKRQRVVMVRININPEKLTALNSPHSEAELLQHVNAFADIADAKASAGPIAQLPAEERFRWLTAVKSSCLETSCPHPGLTGDLNATFDHIFEEMVL